MTWMLDTHALLWALFDPNKLGRNARARLEDPANQVVVSPVSYWEISLKFGLGKLELPMTDPSEIPLAAQQLGLREEALPSDISATFHRLPYAPNHRDPFDRLLVWQAIRRGHTLLSQDRALAFFRGHGLHVEW